MVIFLQVVDGLGYRLPLTCQRLKGKQNTRHFSEWNNVLSNKLGFTKPSSPLGGFSNFSTIAVAQGHGALGERTWLASLA